MQYIYSNLEMVFFTLLILESLILDVEITSLNKHISHSLIVLHVCIYHKPFDIFGAYILTYLKRWKKPENHLR